MKREKVKYPIRGFNKTLNDPHRLNEPSVNKDVGSSFKYSAPRGP